MMQDITGGLRRDGNLLGYVNHKNPLIFQDSFDSGIRSEWGKLVNSGNWQDYIQAVNGKLRFQYTGTGAYDGSVYLSIPSGDWEISITCHPPESCSGTCSAAVWLISGVSLYRLVYEQGPYIRFKNPAGANLASYTGWVKADYRFVKERDKLSVYMKPENGQETLFWSGNLIVPIHRVVLEFNVGSGQSGTMYYDNFLMRRLNFPKLLNMRHAGSYSRWEYTGGLLLDLLWEAPIGGWLVRNRGRIREMDGVERTGAGQANNTSWSSKDGKESLYFNGSNSMILLESAGHLHSMVSDKFTITAWAYIDPNTTDYSIILCKSLADVSSHDYALKILTKHKGLILQINTSDVLILANVINFNRWHHLAVTFDRTLASKNVKAYVDGVLVGQATYTSAVAANSKPIFIGSRNGVAGQLKGYLRNVRLYNTALTQEEILDEMQRDYIPPVETYTKELSSITGTEEPPLQVKYY